MNLLKNCLHLWKPIGHELGELVDNSGMYEDREDVSDTNVGNKWIPVEWRELTEEEKKQYRKFYIIYCMRLMGGTSVRVCMMV